MKEIPSVGAERQITKGHSRRFTAMKILSASAGILLAASLLPCHALSRVETAKSETPKEFEIEPVPPPTMNDAAATAVFTVIEGEIGKGSGGINALHDGKVPENQDEPGKNFFFRNGINGGRMTVDLGKVTQIREVNTYSWHSGVRAPQIFRLYGAKGDEKIFNPVPPPKSDPRASGWKPVAKVDTRKLGAGGQHVSTVSDGKNSYVGEFQHLLFEFDAPDPENSPENTFISEIDVIDAKGPAPSRVPVKRLVTYKSGKYKFTVDYTLAPDMLPWTEKELMPMVYEWYPKLAAMLPSEGYETASDVLMEYREDLGGTPAYAAGSRLAFNIEFFRNQMQGEAKGCVIHEMVHIVQRYGGGKRGKSPLPTPGWVGEGIPDYIRWFIYEPEKKGAEITTGNFNSAKYDGSYRISANFLNWVVQNKDKDFIRKLNAAAREGEYSEKVWEENTGATAAENGEQWEDYNRRKLGIK